MKTKTGLSPTGFRRIAKEIREYRNSLPKKCEEYVRRLSEAGLSVSKAILEKHIDSGETIGSLRIENDSNGKIKRMRVVVESKAILFLEFGTGIKNSSTINPKAGEFGYGPGTYPGKGNWNNTEGWWYIGDDDKPHHTYGIKAAMPMYNASVEMGKKAKDIAMEVFKND